MKTKEEYILEIKPNKANFDYISQSGGCINGTLLSDIEKAMQKYSDQQNAKLREAFLALLKLYALMHEGKAYHKVENLWLEKAGLKEKE